MRSVTGDAYTASGVVFAATGARYRAMAAHAAESVRRHSPSLPIHLFTDEPPSEACFDRVTLLEHPWRRSKIDAMIAAPFERNLFLDADVLVTADIADVFSLLDRFDIALAHDQERNSRLATTVWRRPFPACFPQFNSGVVAYRRSDAVVAMMRAWREAVRANDLTRDQGALRELLWESGLRIATLPPEYNLMDLSPLMRMSRASPAPRIIHHGGARGAARGAKDPLGPAAAAAVDFMRSRDRHLRGATDSDAEPARRFRRKRLLQFWLALEIAGGRLYDGAATLLRRTGGRG